MWALDHLKPAGMMALGIVPESARDPGCPLKYKTVLGTSGTLVSLKDTKPVASRRG